MKDRDSRMNLTVPLGIGTMMWGDTPLDRVINGRILTDETIGDMVRAATTRGVTFFDTAEGYGGGTSERRLAAGCQLGSAVPVQSLVVATKFLPTLWRWSEASFLHALSESNKRLGLASCPVYFLHSPIHPLPIEVWVRAGAKAFREGRIQALGLSNCNAAQVERAVAEAKRHGNVPIVANQIMFNLMVATSPQVQETMRVCKAHNIRIIAYSPIGQGLLCDGLTEEKAKKTRLLRMTGLDTSALAPLRTEVQRIAEAHGKTMGQVALNYVVAKGAIPLVGCRTVKHVDEAIDGVVGWSLQPEEVEQLDAVALGRHTFEKPRWRRSLFIVFISLLMTAYRVSDAMMRTRLTLGRMWSGTAPKKE